MGKRIARIAALIALLAVCSLTAHAQNFCVVTGTVQDPSGFPYNGGTISFQLVNASGAVSFASTPTVPTTPATPVVGNSSAAIGSNGTFTTTLACNSAITPASTLWLPTVCANPQAPPIGATGNCFSTAGISITSNPQDISATLNASSVALFAQGTVGRVATFTATAQGANIGATTLFTVPTNVAGTYRFSCYTVVTRAATTSSTLPACNLIFTDADTSVAQTIAMTTSPTGNTLGLVSGVPNTEVQMFQAKAGTVIQFSTSGYASVGATSMQYSVRIKVEYLGT